MASVQPKSQVNGLLPAGQTISITVPNGGQGYAALYRSSSPPALSALTAGTTTTLGPFPLDSRYIVLAEGAQPLTVTTQEAFQPSLPNALKAANSATGFSLSIAQAGSWSLEPASAQTWTMPPMVNSSVVASTVGVLFDFVNTTTNASAAIIKPSANAAGQFINRQSALSNNQVSLAASQWARFIGQVDVSGVTYWMVMTNGTIS